MKLVAAFLLFSVLTPASLRVQWWPADPERSKRVPGVLRVRLIRQGEGGKYHWPEVELIAIIKNESSCTFPNRFEVAVLGWEDGGKIPAGTSTVYLERYSDVPGSEWRLLGGSPRIGVSDTTAP